MFSVCYILTQRMSALEIFNDSALYKCSLNNNNNTKQEAVLTKSIRHMTDKFTNILKLISTRLRRIKENEQIKTF